MLGLLLKDTSQVHNPQADHTALSPQHLGCLFVAAQNPGERQRFNIHGPQPINTLSASWIEVSYRRLLENARLVLQVVTQMWIWEQHPLIVDEPRHAPYAFHSNDKCKTL